MRYGALNQQRKIVPLIEPYGPTITDPTLQALAVSDETKKVGDDINSIRKNKGFPPLDILNTICIANSNVTDDKLSSTYLREQEYLQKLKAKQ